MPNPKPSNDWGVILSVDSQVKSPRGATKLFVDGLLGLLSGLTLDDQACVVMHPDYLVARSAFTGPTGETDWANMRQTLGQRLRNHQEELVRRGDLPAGTRLSINWAPEDAIGPNGEDIGNRPQCSLKRKA